MKIKSRKEVRKEQRKAKKVKKHEFFLKKKSKFNSKGKEFKSDKGKNNLQQNKNDSKGKDSSTVAKNKFRKRDKKFKPQTNVAQKNFKRPQDRIEHERQREKKFREKLDRDIEKTRIERLKEDNELEEIEIKKLEKQMKLKKGKSKAFVLDGLDYLLDVCDQKVSKNVFENTFEESDEEFESDYENIVGNVHKESNKSKGNSKHKKKNTKDDSDSDTHEDLSGNDNNDDNDEDDNVDDDYSDSDVEGESDSNNMEDEWSDDLQSASDDSDIISGNANKNKINKSTNKNENTKSNKRKGQEIPSKASNKKKVKFKEEEYSNISDACNDESDNESNDDKNVPDNEDKKLWEDIYGRTRDKSGNVVNTYIPPHLRAKHENDNKESNEAVLKLKRQIKGFLNRLAESNMIYISNQIEQLYMNNSRNEMNKTMFNLFQDLLFTQILTPERLISEHAMLIAILHANVGSEIGAYFLQESVMDFIKALDSNTPIEDKKVNNLLIFIMHLYNFQLFHCKLMYDIIYRLMRKLEEKEIELILLALRTVGFNLRKNDPIALKTLILRVQEEVNKIKDTEGSARVKYMLEVLTAIKNNNMLKIPNYNPELIERLRKNLKIYVRKGNYTTELNISLQDLMNAEKHGRWWIVGSAWSGPMPQSDSIKPKSSEDGDEKKFSKKLLELAKKQRMNTDVRKNVFCILMSSEDFMEAFEKLVKLKLKGSAEREIMNVLLHCALQEKSSNPYYMHLANKFCHFDRKYQIMLQCAVWDKIKEMSNFLPIQLTNLAKFVGNIILERGLPISVLKVIEFSEIDKRNVKFMRQVLLTILLNKNENAVMAVFQRIVDSPKLRLFRESLRLFLQHFLLKNSKNIVGEEMTRLTEMVKVCENVLTSFDGGAAF